MNRRAPRYDAYKRGDSRLLPYPDPQGGCGEDYNAKPRVEHQAPHAPPRPLMDINLRYETTPSTHYPRPTKPPRTNGKAPNVIPPNSDTSVTAIRVMTDLIRASHRLDEIYRFTQQGLLPEGYNEKVNQLRATFLPTDPSPETRRTLTEAAKNWLDSGYQTLEKHYEDKIRELRKQLRELPCPDPKTSWQNICDGAANNLHGTLTANLAAAIQNALRAAMREKLAPPHPEPIDPRTKTPPTPTADLTDHNDRPRHEDPTDHQVPTTPPATQGNFPPARDPSKNHPYPQTVTPTVDAHRPFLTVHALTGDQRKSGWRLSPRRPVLILGDSNLKRLPLIWDNRIQVDSYPGATIFHGAEIMEHLTPSNPTVKRVVLSFGINCRNAGARIDTLQKTFRRMYQRAQTAFPEAQIYVPIIGFSEELPLAERSKLREINVIIKNDFPFLPTVPRDAFNTSPRHDKIHWSKGTGIAMWNLWRNHLNLNGPHPNRNLKHP